MSKAIFLLLVVYLAAVTSSAIVDWNDVPDDDVSSDKRAACRDRMSNCKSFSRRYCRAAYFYSRCRRTCGKCRTKLRPTIPSLPPCTKSENRFCPSWAQKGFCRNGHRYRVYMSQNCPAACRFCRVTKKPGIKKPIPKGVQAVSVNIQRCLEAHNRYRARHGAAALRWDRELAAGAKKYAVHLATIKKMVHARGNFGENLAMRNSWGGRHSKYTCAQATKAWYDEVKDYSFSSPGFSYKTGHFTQVVWKSTRRLGVGIARNGGFTIIVARYSPAGNTQGRQYFRENVGRRRY